MQVQPGSKHKTVIDPANTLAHMTQLIMPQHANSLGITFGGQASTSGITFAVLQDL